MSDTNQSNRAAGSFALQSGLFLLVLALLTSSLSPCLIAQEPVVGDQLSFAVSLESGSVLTLEIPDQSLRWTSLSLPDKGMKEQIIQLKNVRNAILGKEAVGKQVAHVRQLLQDLHEDDYAKREAAEKELAKQEVGARFRSLIEVEKNHPVLEVRYRVQRILAELSKFDFEIMGAFDQLQLSDGTMLYGDLGDVSFECIYRGQSLRIARTDIESIRAISGNSDGKMEVPASLPVNVEVLQRFDNRWGKDQHQFIDFQTSPNGEPLVTRADVSNTFVPFGLKMRSEKPGYVGISGYAFRADCPPKENSICVFESVGTAYQRFKGVMEFQFCLPNQRGLMAGINEFGMFVSRVDKPRDFILEAYNSEGQLLGTVEASDANCTFHGIRSTEPITRLRLLSNPYLFSLSRKVDEDFCVDDVYFSHPRAVPYLRENQFPGVLTIRGDRLIGDWTIDQQTVRVNLNQIATPITIPLEEVRSMEFGNSVESVPKGQRVWHAMLEDRTILAVDPEAGFTTTRFAGMKLAPEQIVGLWLAPNGLRFPVSGDWETNVSKPTPGNVVMVYPTGRIIATDLNLSATGYRWNKVEKREQDIWIRTGETGKAADEDPTPDLSQIEYAKTSPEQVPTLWLKEPPNWQPTVGLIRLTDGQQFVLGGASGIKIAQFQSKSITLQYNDQKHEVMHSEIASLDLPVKE